MAGLTKRALGTAGSVRRLPWPLLISTLIALERRRRALTPDERRRLLELLAKVQEAAAAMDGDPADHTARRRRPARLARPG